MPLLTSPLLIVLIPVTVVRAVRGGGGVKGVLYRAVRLYQADLSELTPPCRFTPSCSEYAAQALDSHGAARGSWLTLRRLLRCHPGAAGGPDPVPARN